MKHLRTNKLEQTQFAELVSAYGHLAVERMIGVTPGELDELVYGRPCKAGVVVRATARYQAIAAYRTADKIKGPPEMPSDRRRRTVTEHEASVAAMNAEHREFAATVVALARLAADLDISTPHVVAAYTQARITLES